MTHINPGTDTTINPVVIDDSKRGKPPQQPHPHCEHEVVCRMYYDPEWDTGEKTEPCITIDCDYDTRTHSASQQRIEQAIKELQSCIDNQDEVDLGRHVRIAAYKYAIALLQAGEL